VSNTCFSIVQIITESGLLSPLLIVLKQNTYNSEVTRKLRKIHVLIESAHALDTNYAFVSWGKIAVVKNLSGILDVYSQILLTRLIHVENTQLFLKLTNFHKNWHGAFHSFTTKKVSFMWPKKVPEKHKRVWMTLIHIVITNWQLLPTSCC